MVVWRIGMQLFSLSDGGGLETKGRLCGERSYLPSLVRIGGDGGLIQVQGIEGRVCGVLFRGAQQNR